jgi:hypothetical protein
MSNMLKGRENGRWMLSQPPFTQLQLSSTYGLACFISISVYSPPSSRVLKQIPGIIPFHPLTLENTSLKDLSDIF